MFRKQQVIKLYSAVLMIKFGRVRVGTQPNICNVILPYMGEVSGMLNVFIQITKYSIVTLQKWTLKKKKL